MYFAKIIFILTITSIFIYFPQIVYSEKPLELKPIEGSHSVGFDQNNLGIRAFRKKNYINALKHFHIASMADPKSGEIYFNIALTLAKLKTNDEIYKYMNLANKYSEGNLEIKNSELHKIFNCNLKPKKHCDSKPPNPYKIEGYESHSYDSLY